MRVLQIIPTLKKGGAERLCLDICNELRKRGVEVLLMLMYDENDYPEASAGIPMVVCNSKVQLSITGKNKIDLAHYKQIVSEFNPDIIHSHLYESEVFSREFIFENVKYITHAHSSVPQYRRLRNVGLNKRQVAEYYEKLHLFKMYRACNNRFIAISEYTRQYLLETLPATLRKNILLLHNAINFKRFNAAYTERSSASINMINVGRFWPHKNQAFLLKVLRQLLQTNPSTTLTFLGDGPARPGVMQQAGAMGLLHNVKFEGSVSRVEDYLKQANLYVHSALSEPFGLVIVEAMATGLPVVCLDGGGNRDIMEQGKNGFLITGQDEKLFSQKVLSIFSSHNTYSAFSTSAVNTARRFDIDVYTDKLLEFYKS